MCQIKLLFIILVGANRLHVVTSYSGGEVQDACQSMTPQHGSFTPKNSPAPYKVDTTNISSSLDEIMVILRLNESDGEPFRGFLLMAENSHGHRPVGTFTLINSRESRLLACNGNTASAVSHINNHPKREIKVKWKRPMDGNYTFRATFVQYFNEFWVPELRDPIITTAPTTFTETATTPTTTTVTTTTITTTAASTMTARATTNCTTKNSTTIQLVILPTLFKYGCLAKMAYNSYSGIWFQVHVFHVFLMSCFAIGNVIALIFVLVEGWKTEAHSVLICVVTALTCIQIVVALLRCGPSHELRFIFKWFHRLNALAIVCLTMAAVFTGLACIEATWPHKILQILMGGLVAWICLFFILQLLMSWWRKTDQKFSSDKKKNSGTVLQVALVVVFTLGDAAFLVVLLKLIFTS